MICTRTASTVGTFLAGERAVGEAVWKDAVTGGPLTGEAITGAWWAYACPDGLKLGGVLPQVLAIEAEAVPAAGLILGTYLPDRAGQLDITLDVPAAGMLLGGELPGLQIDSVLAVGPAGLLLGGYLPDAVEVLVLIDISCLEVDLLPVVENELVLVGAGTVDADLVGVDCR